MKNLKKLLWISLLNTFSTGDQDLVLILSKRTSTRTWGNVSSLQVSCWMQGQDTRELCPQLRAVFCPLPSARAVLVNDSQQWFLCLYPGIAHHLFPKQEDAALGKHRPNTNHPGLPSFSGRGILKPGGFIWMHFVSWRSALCFPELLRSHLSENHLKDNYRGAAN